MAELRAFRSELLTLRTKERRLKHDRQNLLAGLKAHRLEASEVRKAAKRMTHSDELPMVEATSDGKISYWNPAAARMFGYQKAQVLGKPLSFLCPSSAITALWDQAKIGRRVEGREVVCSRKDKSRFAVLITAIPRRDISGRTHGVALLFRDLRRRQAEEALFQLVESSADAIISQDRDGAIVSWNSGAERIFGYPMEEALGRPMAMLAPPGEPDPVAELVANARGGEPARSIEAARLSRAGQRLVVSMTISPTFDPQGAVVGISCIARDVTERHRAERELESKTAALAVTNRELELFTAAAAHDLQEPVRKVRTFAGRIAAGPLDAGQRDALERLLGSARQMTTLIEGLMAYARVSAGPIKAAPVELNEVVEETLRAFAPRIQESRARVDAGNLPAVHADARLLGGLFEQLLSNALKFAGTRPPRITIRARRRRGAVEIMVKDNGIGFENKYRENIFEPFQRLNVREEYPGNALGLAICRRIAGRLGGKIEARSSPGRGATVTLTLPAARP